jgi:lipopolysaccharide cholinephosphotransferase
MKFMKKYKNVNDLRLLQLLQLKLLVDIKKITTKLNLDYFLIAGSLLGSIRHKGFIPWDSDADIAMTREDYNTLIQNIDLLGNDLFLQCDETDVSNKTGFAKLRLKNTLFIESGNKINSKDHGFYIDIFPLDKYVYKSKMINTVNHYLYKYLIRLKAFKNGKKYSSTNIRSFISFIICAPSFIIPLKTIKFLQNKISQKYSNTNSGFTNNFNSKYGLEKQFIALETYFPPSMTYFEGHKFKAPNKIDFWLKKIYGDYNILPKKQIKHTNNLMKNFIIDFGPYSYLLGKPEIFVLKELDLYNND